MYYLHGVPVRGVRPVSRGRRGRWRGAPVAPAAGGRSQAPLDLLLLLERADERRL